jgi:gamma-glutamyltranspeptidase/glutathione hydrolase
VVEFALTSPAGGGFCLARTQSGREVLFDFFTQTPQRKRKGGELDFYPVTVQFGGGVEQEFHVGLGSMAVPGSIAGAFHIHRRLGRLPLAVVAEPALQYAKQGVPLDAFQHYCLTILQPILLASAELQSLFAPQGRLLQEGETVTMPHLAATLDYLVQEGPQAFYEGAIAQQLVADCDTKGGHLTHQDLADYRVIERQPLRSLYRGRTLLTNPPPSSGGTLIAFSLKLLEPLQLREIGYGTQAHLNLLAKVMRLTNVARNRAFDTNVYDSNVGETFLATDHLDTYARQLRPTANKWGSTTHFSVVDGEGNAASITASNGEGSAYTIPGTGVMVNNMLGEDDLNPQGFHQWPENVRISSMMAPSMMLDGDRVEIVLGSGGSKRIRTAIVQAISNMVDFDMPVTTAVRNPRLHWEDGTLNIEPGFAPPDIDDLTQLADIDGSNESARGQRLVRWQQQNMFFGGVHTLMTTADGRLDGAGDRRRNGVVLWA